MAFLRINEWTIPVDDGSVRIETEEIGHKARAINGVSLASRRQLLRRYRIQTSPLTRDQGTALRGMLLGTHNTWSFESPYLTYSTKGSKMTGNATISTTTPMWGSRKLQVIPTFTATFPFDATDASGFNATGAFGPSYSWSFWYEATAGSGSWAWYCYTYDGTSGARYFLNGASIANPSLQSFFTANTIVFYNNTGTTYAIDALALFPYRIPDAWVTEMYSLARPTPSDSPRLWVDGNILSSDMGGNTFPLSMTAELTGESVLQATINGVWEPSARQLEFVLSESL